MSTLAQRLATSRKTAVTTGVSMPVVLVLVGMAIFLLIGSLVSEIFRIIRDLNEHEGLTVLVVEQNAHIALQVSHNAYVLEVGRVALSGPSADLEQHESVRRSYLGY